ncbi:MAG: SGNH/GDSL hydrolase family protein, partial [Actinomycetota bacterium]
RSRPGLPARIGSVLFKGVREVESDRRPLADWWEAQNRAALEESGPLWLVFGDSASQGLGASEPEAGYVPRVRTRLRERTGEPWRVLNLSVTGAKMADVVDRQLAAWASVAVEAQLVTSFVGANDLLYPWGTDGAVRDAERLVAELPVGTLQSKMGGGPPSRPKASAVNDVLRSARDRGHLDLFQPWDWPSMSGAWAADRFHPNDVGYGHLTEAVWKAVEPAVGG